MLNMACTLFRLTPEEALRGVTRERRARARACADRGTLAAGQRADFALWDARRIRPSSPTGSAATRCRRVVAGGRTRTVRDERPSSTCTAARAPLLVSLPHVGTDDPRTTARALRAARAGVEDTDWHLDALYAFARELGASLLRAALLALRRST